MSLRHNERAFLDACHNAAPNLQWEASMHPHSDDMWAKGTFPDNRTTISALSASEHRCTFGMEVFDNGTPVARFTIPSERHFFAFLTHLTKPNSGKYQPRTINLPVALHPYRPLYDHLRFQGTSTVVDTSILTATFERPTTNLTERTLRYLLNHGIGEGQHP